MIVKYKALVLVAALSSQGIWAQSYKEKEAALETRVAFDTGAYIPELQRAEAINQIYTLVFQSGANSYFDKSAGLVRKIVLQDLGYGRDLNNETVAIATRLRGNTLYYPVLFDAAAIIAAGLTAEAEILQQIGQLNKTLRSKIPTLKIITKEDMLWGGSNPNFTRLSALNDFANVLEARPDLLNAVKTHKSFELIDTTERYGDNGFYLDHESRRKSAQLLLGRTGFYEEELFIDAVGLEALLEVGALHGFTVRPAAFLSATSFGKGLVALSEVLDTNTLRRLKSKGVLGFEIDVDFARREELFQNGILYVGTSQAEIIQVIDLLIP